MDRRGFLKGTGAGAVALALGRRVAAGAAGGRAASRSEGRPNLVLVLSDDHSYPHLGCYGDPAIHTPNLDRFAAEGMRFDRAFTTAPQCVPSRASLMTGRSAVAIRMTRFTSPLPPDVVALPDLLRRAGYFCGACRRYYHLDGPGKPGPVTKAVFDKYGLRTFAKRLDYADVSGPRDQTPVRIGEFLDRVPAGKPFFLWVSFNDPHHKWDKVAIPEPHDPAKLRLDPPLPDLPEVRADLGRYYDEIARMDAEFQSVLEMLAKRGKAQDTIVVFMGDNGYAFPHGKGSLYDPGLHVPLLVRWPGKVKPGGATGELISGEDIAPTLLAAAGLAAPKEMSGVSFLPLLLGKPFQGRRHVFAERGPHGSATFTMNTPANGFDLSRCVRSKRHKLIYNCSPHQVYAPVDSGRDPGWQAILGAHKAGKLAADFDRAYFTSPRPVYELFDLEKDRGELHNLAGRKEYAEIEQELKVALQEKMILDYDFLPLPLRE